MSCTLSLRYQIFHPLVISYYQLLFSLFEIHYNFQTFMSSSNIHELYDIVNNELHNNNELNNTQYKMDYIIIQEGEEEKITYLYYLIISIK